MKSRPIAFNRMTTQKHEDARPSFSLRTSTSQPHRMAVAYARSRMNNAAIHDRAPRATVRTRIGIVSHPHHRDPSRWPAIRRQMMNILAEHGGRGTEAVTLLAAATDRLFAMVAREQGMRLSLVIPCHDFQNVFATPDEISEYVHLRTLAHSHTMLDRKTFNREAFEEASKFVIDTCDLLVAVGSGKTVTPHGGTGGLVQYARAREKLLVWIDPEAPVMTPRLVLIR